MKKNLLVLLTFILSTSLFSQIFNSPPCYSDELFQFQTDHDPELLQKRSEFEKTIADYIKSDDYLSGKNEGANLIIPVVFHIIHQGESIGQGSNISKNQILDAVDRLNKDYTRQNTDANKTPAAFASLASATGIQFELATIDPNGKCTNGINRIKNARLSQGLDFPNTDKIQALVQWPPTKYLNIWVSEVVNPPGFPAGNCCVFGVGSYPQAPSNTQGVVIRHNMVGSIGTAINPFPSAPHVPNYLGRTLTHETGHFLGLYHLWGQNDNQPCGDDLVSDTPKQFHANSFKCPTFPHNANDTRCGVNIGPNGEMAMNYMDYSYGNCINMFTIKQADRMKATITNYRSNLVTASNHKATGVNGNQCSSTQAPSASFTSSASKVCQGEAVTFTDQSAGSPTSWSWQFSGGTPATSTQQNPTVTFGTAGIQAVQLTATNSAGSNKTTQNITVDASVNVTTNGIDASCNQNNGSATANPTGGNGTYAYQWSPGGLKTQTISNLPAGTYTANVTSGACTSKSAVTIKQTGKPSVSVSLGTVTCNTSGSGIAEVTAQVSGGVKPYSYSWNDGKNQNTQTAQLALSGISYTVTVTDKSDCKGSATVTLPVYMTLTTDYTPATCNTCNNGTATVTAKNNYDPTSFTYLWNDSKQQTTKTATGLGSGTYKVIVTDDKGCSSETTVSIPLGMSEANTMGRISVFPNPSQGDKTYIEFPDGIAIQLNIEIFDILGKSVYHKNKPAGSQIDRLVIPNTSIGGEGIYFVRISYGEVNHTTRLVIGK